MTIDKTSEQYFEEFFNRWSLEKNIKNMKFTHISKPIGYNCASSYDDWKTTTLEDTVKTKEYSTPVDMDILYDLAKKKWDEEIDEDMCDEYGGDDEYFYSDNTYIFDSVLKDYKNNIYEEYENEFEF